MSNEPEPNGWELLRGFVELRTTVEKIASGMVSQTQHDHALGRIHTLETDARMQRQTAEADAKEQRKTRAQQWFAIAMVGLAAIGTVVTSLVLASITGGQ